MDHPALQHRSNSVLYFVLWTIVGVIFAGIIAPLVSMPLIDLVLFGAVFGYLYGLIAFLLWSVVKYGDYTSQPLFQRMVSYSALALLTVFSWLSFGFLLLYVALPTKDISPFLHLIPIYSVLGFLIYIVVVQVYTIYLKDIGDAEREEIQEKIVEEEESFCAEEPKEILERVAVKFGQKIEVILVSDILYVQAEGDYVMIFTAKGHHLKEQTMKYFEEHLPRSQFVRVHRSYIVNITIISRIELYEKQNQLITLQNGKQIGVSAAGYKQLKKTLNL
jgi:hypothetical protein